jgi:hypothetical protein
MVVVTSVSTLEIFKSNELGSSVKQLVNPDVGVWDMFDTMETISSLFRKKLYFVKVW